MFNRALFLLRTLVGPQADFRRNQWKVIEALAEKHRRVLVVERAGWGKSIVYFLATKLLREHGSGPTLLVTPLLSLVRNQMTLARRIGIRAGTIHSGNRDEWEAVESALARDEVDILAVSPERLNGEFFRNSTVPAIRGRVGMLVVDEAHCISDWSHDFRPDFRRVCQLIETLPNGVPILAATATANSRITSDIAQQLGHELLVIRGPLARTTLRLQNLVIPHPAERLAWLAENLPKFEGSGIVYCLTIGDTQRVAEWLRLKGMDVRTYHSGQDRAERNAIERALLGNKVKALVATVALGMGFDKPDLAFVVHFQRPGSVVAYYQQVGRAGRGIDKAYGVLLRGAEDDEIVNHFIEAASLRPDAARKILSSLGKSEGLTTSEILAKVNIGPTALEVALKTLEIDGAIRVESSTGRQRFFSTSKPWKPDIERIRGATMFRKQELAEMREYVNHRGCLMEFLAKALGDSETKACGVCANCQGRGFKPTADEKLVAEAVSFLNRDETGASRK